VHPIEVEGFGLVLLEAAMQGLPAVAGRLGGVPEIVRDNETGLLVAPGDRMALAAALQRLLDDEALRTKLGHAAREAARHFTWDRCARQIFGTVRA
jgi:glycosyltransferase involved in cell wall biosynthesis